MNYIHDAHQKTSYPIKVVQFGEGNFLRGFADQMIDILNKTGACDLGVAVIKPRSGRLDALNSQNGLYTVLLRGSAQGRIQQETQMVDCIQTALGSDVDYDAYSALSALETLQVVLSNTTEAGMTLDLGDSFDLCPPRSFPGKLTKFLFDRFEAFGGDPARGLIIMPLELIEDNGAALREHVLALAARWDLPDSFSRWVTSANLFCNTLVDRIITGFPKEEAEALWADLGYRDDLIVAGEPFGLWVIETDDPDRVKAVLPFEQAGLPVLFTQDQKPYRERKVRVLNGAHTGTVLAAYLAGLDTVGACMEDKTVRAFMERMIESEIAPTVPLPPAEVADFAASVLERFANPFIRHELLSIALNSVSKWKSRILPSLLDAFKNTGSLPPLLTFSFAALLAFYTPAGRNEKGLTGLRGQSEYLIS
ncbi:MAG: tagaturonate reductase, partial [Oscillospiraceae bacterium]|nr:tagaturonate reductase [Oscillospiraceae bacterium]